MMEGEHLLLETSKISEIVYNTVLHPKSIQVTSTVLQSVSKPDSP